MEFCKYNFLIQSCANHHEFLLGKINRSGKDAADIEYLKLCENGRYLYELIDVYSRLTETCKTCTNESCAWNKEDSEVLRSKCDDIMNNIKEMLNSINDMIKEKS